MIKHQAKKFGTGKFDCWRKNTKKCTNFFVSMDKIIRKVKTKTKDKTEEIYKYKLKFIESFSFMSSSLSDPNAFSNKQTLR